MMTYQSIHARGEDVELFRVGREDGRVVLVLADEIGHDEDVARAWVEALDWPDWAIELRTWRGSEMYDGSRWHVAAA